MERMILQARPEGDLNVYIAELESNLDVAWHQGDEGKIYASDVLKRLKALAARASSGPQEKEICICAAVQFADGRIVRGHRHDSCFRTAEGWTPKPDFHGHVQGFITSCNRFVDRAEGARLQNAAGIESAHYHGPVNEELFSEDLYFDSHDHAAWNKPYTESASAPPSRPQRCPKCDSPSPELHPAVQHEGEVQPCSDSWHDAARIPVGFTKREDGYLVALQSPPQQEKEPR